MREGASDQTTCPACASWRILCALGTDLDMCLKCHRCWERVNPGEAFMVDGEMLAFKRPCDNCAFRGGSDERKDSETWLELQAMLRYGKSEFFCHKGVPMKASVEEIAGHAPDSRMAFDFPVEVKTLDIAGETRPYEAYVREHMRLCRGYLNKHIKTMLRDFA